MRRRPVPEDDGPVRRSAPPSWRRTVPMVAVALACALLLGLVYWASVRTIQGRVLSDAALQGALQSNGVVSSTVDRVLNGVSVGSLLVAMAVVAFIALLRLRRVQGFAAVGVLVGANVTTLLLKRYVLERPDLGVTEVGPATLNSLPSGHTTAAFSAVGALLMVVPRRLRVPVALVGAAYGAVTGLATMSAGWHRAADAIAALLVVGLWTTIAALAVLLLGPDQLLDDPLLDERGTRLHPAVRWPTAAALACVLLGAVVALLLSATTPLLESDAGPWLAFGSGVLLVLGTALGTAAALLVVLDLMDPPGV